MTISLIIPTYNEEPYLRRCLDSVTKQKDDGLQVIVVDDASTDNSKDIIQEYKQFDYCFISKNMGLSYARNHGIDYAQGDYVSFLDADDELLPGAVSAWRKAIKTYPADTIFQFNHLRHYKAIGRTCRRYANKPGVYDVSNYLECQAWQGAWNKLIKRESMMRFNNNLRYGEDGFWSLEHLLKGDHIRTIEFDTVLHHFENPNQLTKIVSKEQLEKLDLEQRKLLAKHCSPFEPWRNIKAIVDMIQGCHDNEKYQSIRGNYDI